jgi:hypothetical protein
MIYWRGVLINENCKKFMKKVNQLRYKAEWLGLKMNSNFCLNIDRNVIDWSRSLNVIMKEFKSEISDFNNDIMAYNIKNFLEILPTLEILFRRNPVVYEYSRCV